MDKKRVRMKTFEHDGATYTIGALTFNQVREFFGDGKKSKVIEVAAASLQAGEPEENWTAEAVEDAFDPAAFQLLLDDIWAFNGLGPRTAPVGESPAADSTSSNSAAESS